MATKKRKSRAKVSKKVDLLQPLPLNIYELGGENDPCFGKLNDPTHPICRQCGDCEVCAIVQSQGLHKIRAEAETKNNFKDLEEENLDKLSMTTKFRRLLYTILKRDKSITRDNFQLRAMSGLGISEKRFDSLLDKLMKRKPELQLNKGTITKKK